MEGIAQNHGKEGGHALMATKPLAARHRKKITASNWILEMNLPYKIIGVLKCRVIFEHVWGSQLFFVQCRPIFHF